MWKYLFFLSFFSVVANAQQITYIPYNAYVEEYDSVGEWQMTLYNYAARTLVYQSNNHFAEWLPAEPENNIIKYRLLYKCDSSLGMNFKIFWANGDSATSHQTDFRKIVAEDGEILYKGWAFRNCISYNFIDTTAFGDNCPKSMLYWSMLEFFENPHIGIFFYDERGDFLRIFYIPDYIPEPPLLQFETEEEWYELPFCLTD